MNQLLPNIVIGFLTTLVFIPVIIFLTNHYGVFDIPGGRKIHKSIKPSLGGIAIFLGFLLSILVVCPNQDLVRFKYLLLSIFIITLVGISDDLFTLKPIYKLIGQLSAAMVAIGLGNIRLESFHGILSIGQLPYPISYFITLFIIIVITNSINLIDGLDGLAATLSSIALIMLAYYFYNSNQMQLALLIVGLLGAIIGFMCFNWEPSRIFMGDTGALMIGFVLALLAIIFIQDHTHFLPQGTLSFKNPVTIAVSFISVPLFDTLRIFIIRISKKRSPFTADKGHIHHLLLRLGLNHAQSCILLGGINLLLIATAFSIRQFEDNISIWVLILVLYILNQFLKFFIKSKLRRKTFHVALSQEDK